MLLVALPPFKTAMAQENMYTVVDRVELPAGLKVHRDSSCQVEFREKWTINVDLGSISKEVEAYTVPCANGIMDVTSADEPVRLEGITYEFSFLDPHQFSLQKLQDDIITLISQRIQGHTVYDLREQLLSVKFHEEWIVEPGNQEIVKKVQAITPVVWQRRQTSDGVPVNDAESGLPVYYTHQLDRISLRDP